MAGRPTGFYLRCLVAVTCMIAGCQPVKAFEKAPSVIYWKNRKVGGSTICHILAEYSNKYSLPLGMEGGPASEENIKRLRKQGLGKGACAALNPYHSQVKVMCCHAHQIREGGLHAWVKQRYSEEQGLLQFVTLRKPIAQMVSWFFFSGLKETDGFPEAEVVKKFIQSHYIDKNEYLQEWIWKPEEGLKKHDSSYADHAIGRISNADNQNLTMLIFERMDESYVLLWDKLNLTLEEGMVPHQKLRPHPGADELDEDVRKYFEHVSELKGYERVYQAALKRFDEQVDAYGQEKMKERVAALQSLREQEKRGRAH